MLKEIKARVNDVGTYHLQGNGNFSYMGHVFEPRLNIAELSNEAYKIVKDIGGTVLSFMSGKGFFKYINPLMVRGSDAIYPTAVSHYLEVGDVDINARINLLYVLLSGNYIPDETEYQMSYALLYVCFLIHLKLTTKEIIESMEIIAQDLGSSPYRTDTLDRYIKRLAAHSVIVDKKLLLK